MKVLSVLKYLFSIVGAVLLLGAAASYKSADDFLAEAVSARGTVAALERSQNGDSVSYFPLVIFTDEQGETQRFRSSTGRNPAAYGVGEQVEVLYLSNRPDEARINALSSIWGVTIVLGVLGGVFFSIGMAMLLIARSKARKADHLKRHGVVVQAVMKPVERNDSLTVNGRNPYRIVGHWLNPKTSEVHIFKSENIWFDPSDYVTGETLKVFVNRDDPKKYHVDISFLPRLAG